MPSCGHFSIFKDTRIYPGHAGVEGNGKWTAEKILSEVAYINPNEKGGGGTGFDHLMRYINDDVHLSNYPL